MPRLKGQSGIGYRDPHGTLHVGELRDEKKEGGRWDLSGARGSSGTAPAPRRPRGSGRCLGRSLARLLRGSWKLWDPQLGATTAWIIVGRGYRVGSDAVLPSHTSGPLPALRSLPLCGDDGTASWTPYLGGCELGTTEAGPPECTAFLT